MSVSGFSRLAAQVADQRDFVTPRAAGPADVNMRMRAIEAAELLRTLAQKRDGITYVEPAGLRAAAEDALAMIEDRPSSTRVRAAFEAAAQSSASITSEPAL